MNVRLRRLPVLPLMVAGSITGFVVGLFAGCVLGALLAYFAGAVIDWHRQLGFTLGVTEDLLPLGEQIGILQTVSDLWWLVVPATGVAIGLLNALVGVLAGGLTAGLYNRFAHGIALDLEVTDPALAAVPAPAPARDEASRRAVGRRPGEHAAQ